MADPALTPSPESSLPELFHLSFLKEHERFRETYTWVERHLPPSFFEDADPDMVSFVTHSLMGLNLQGFFSEIHYKNIAIILTLDEPGSDIRILKNYQMRGIKNYRTFVSNAPPPFEGITKNLRLAMIVFTRFQEHAAELPKLDALFPKLQERHPSLTFEQFGALLQGMNARFLRSLTEERLLLACEVLLRAQNQDACQYEVRKIENWREKKESPSLQIVLAWKNVPKHAFLYKIAKVTHRHNLAIKRVAATYTQDNLLVLSLGLHGLKGKAAWEEANLDDFFQELLTLKYFPGKERLEEALVDTGRISGNLGNLLKTMHTFIHELLAPQDPNLYSASSIEEALLRHPELTTLILEAFVAKFKPLEASLKRYEDLKGKILPLIAALDTGNEANDSRRKNVLSLALNFVEYTLKTNFFLKNKTAFSFRLDPQCFTTLPYAYAEKFPDLPFGLFFIQGMYSFGFHLRFRDLARGGLRTVIPRRVEQLAAERASVLSECYQLAYTQQKKNKDIPEGGAKGVIFLESLPFLEVEGAIYREDLVAANLSPEEIEKHLEAFLGAQAKEHLFFSQRAYVKSLMKLINCKPDGILKHENIVDYYQKPEYLYLGPDENMQDEMIVWISEYAKQKGYKPGSSFMSSKPGAGINHKEFGVTSCGVNVCMEEVLRHLGIDPAKERFTIKMTGGPDGDVAGNQMHNLYTFFPKTARLLTTVDVSGLIFDPEGLDLPLIDALFKEGKPIRNYAVERLSEGGFLLDQTRKREESAYAQQTLLQRKRGGKIVEEWLSGNEMNHLLRTHVHKTKADIFIPGGGRPRTLNDTNYQDFLDESGKPTARAIIEGANLYLTPGARLELEKRGTLIIKDSSANKGGVICSSYEVLCGLTLSDEEFLANKEELVREILEIIAKRARDEVLLLLCSVGSKPLSIVSDEVSAHINQFTDEIAAFLADKELSLEPKDPLVQCLFEYAPPLLRERYTARILSEVPAMHKKAIIACFLAQKLVYERGLKWAPSVVDVLPLIVKGESFLGS